jgi:hypothetical protein
MLFSASASFPAIVVLDFDNVPSTCCVQANLESEGFRFSPNCHYDLPSTGGFMNSHWLGFDAAGCFDTGNPNFLGPAAAPKASLYVDHFGSNFHCRVCM